MSEVINVWTVEQKRNNFLYQVSYFPFKISPLLKAKIVFQKQMRKHVLYILTCTSL